LKASASDEPTISVNETPKRELSSSTIHHLAARDDAAVIAALWADRTFGRTPRLGDRRAETGAAARIGMASGAFAARLAAREADMTATAGSLRRLLDGGAAPDDLVARGEGWAAVDSARGRLYHACKLDRSGRIADYRMVAPTEWNFHPDGPFIQALLGARIGQGAEAKRRVESLAFVFDPCVKAEAEILESAHA